MSAENPAARRRVPPRSDVVAATLDPWGAPLAGRLVTTSFTSTVLAGNPLGDPATRPLSVYLPPGYDEAPDRRYPSVYVLQGYSGAVLGWSNRVHNRHTFVENADALFQRGDAPPAIVVMVDAWTSYGGSQFVDSPGTGRYQTYICEEILPWVDATYRTLAAPRHRGVVGKSSGGFGAMIFGMLRPDLFGGFATHAGDSLYEGCYIPEFLRAARALRDHYDGSYENFWTDYWARAEVGQAGAKPSDGSLEMVYGCAAAFSAEPDGTVTLPFDLAHRAAARRRLATLARLGSGTDGAAACRCTPVVRRRSGSTPGAVTTGGSTSAPRPSGVRSPMSGCRIRRSTSSSSTPPTQPSTTATPCRWRTSRRTCRRRAAGGLK